MVWEQSACGNGVRLKQTHVLNNKGQVPKEYHVHLKERTPAAAVHFNKRMKQMKHMNETLKDL